VIDNEQIIARMPFKAGADIQRFDHLLKEESNRLQSARRDLKRMIKTRASKPLVDEAYRKLEAAKVAIEDKISEAIKARHGL